MSSSRHSKRRARQLRRQLLRLERRWERANRQHGLPARPAIEAHYERVMALRDEIKRLG